MIFYYCLAPHHFASLHSLRLALSDTMPFTGANIEQDRERGAKGGEAEWSPSEQRAQASSIERGGFATLESE